MGSKSGLGAMLVAGFLPSTTLVKLPSWTSVHEAFRSQEQRSTHEVLSSSPMWFSLATSTVSPQWKQSSNPLLPSCPKSPTETGSVLPPSSFSLCPYQHNNIKATSRGLWAGLFPIHLLLLILLTGKASLLYYQSGIRTLFKVSKVSACVLGNTPLQMPTTKDVQNLWPKKYYASLIQHPSQPLPEQMLQLLGH